MNITLNQAEKLLPALLNAKITPFLHSSPALGKSSLAKSLADKAKLKVIDLRLTELDSSDLNGLPYFKEGKSTYLPFDVFPLSNSPKPEGYNGWLLLLDEINSALPSVQAAAYKLILDRTVGQHKLHDDVYIIACGNKDTDNAITFPLSSALISRFAHFYIEPNTNEWIDWAISNGISLDIISFLGFRPSLLYTFNADSSEPYASPRTWEMLSKALKELDDDINNSHLPLFASLVGDGVATEFMTYLQLKAEVPTIDTIMKNPTSISLPSSLGLQWATVLMVVNHIDVNNYDKLSGYLQRFSGEMQVIALRYIVQNKQALLNKTMQWRKQLASELYL